MLRKHDHRGEGGAQRGKRFKSTSFQSNYNSMSYDFSEWILDPYLPLCASAASVIKLSFLTLSRSFALERQALRQESMYSTAFSP